MLKQSFHAREGCIVIFCWFAKQASCTGEHITALPVQETKKLSILKLSTDQVCMCSDENVNFPKPDQEAWPTHCRFDGDEMLIDDGTMFRECYREPVVDR